MKPKLPTTRGASILTLLAAIAAVPHLLVAIAIGALLLAVLVYAGVALPAVWSAKAARRTAAAAVLSQILALLRRL